MVSAGAKDILDLGTGPGQPSLLIAKTLPSARVHATDVQEGMIKKAQKRAEPEHNLFPIFGGRWKFQDPVTAMRIKKPFTFCHLSSVTLGNFLETGSFCHFVLTFGLSLLCPLCPCVAFLLNGFPTSSSCHIWFYILLSISQLNVSQQPNFQLGFVQFLEKLVLLPFFLLTHCPKFLLLFLLGTALHFYNDSQVFFS